MQDPGLIFFALATFVVLGLTNVVWASTKLGGGKDLAWDAINQWMFPKAKVGGGPSRRTSGHGRVVGGGIWSTFAVTLLVGVIWGTVSVGAVFAPVDLAELKFAVDSCVGYSDDGSACASSSYGAIGEWDVSRVTSLANLFNDKQSFNQDLSNWGVSNVTTLENTFYQAHAFNSNLSTWEVSKVTTLYQTFYDALH